MSKTYVVRFRACKDALGKKDEVGSGRKEELGRGRAEEPRSRAARPDTRSRSMDTAAKRDGGARNPCLLYHVYQILTNMTNYQGCTEEKGKVPGRH